MNEVNNGATLTQLLKKSGTGEAKLVALRWKLRDMFEKEGRVATSGELIDFMREQSVFSLGTIEKALRIKNTGSPAVVTVENVEIPFEDQLLMDKKFEPRMPPNYPGVDLAKLERTFGPASGPIQNGPGMTKAEATAGEWIDQPGITKTVAEAGPVDNEWTRWQASQEGKKKPADPFDQSKKK